jgi:hypothetical protein
MVSIVIAEAASTGPAAANVLIVLLGAALLALSAWCWAGRSSGARWWSGRPFGARLMLGLVPGLGLLVCTVGLGVLFGLSGPLASVLLAVPFLIGLLLELAGMFALIPRWWGPGWYRRSPAGKRGRGRR